MKRLMLIDGHSLAYRAFYALPTSMTAPDGTCTNAVHGFLSMMLKAVDEYAPDGLAVAFDVHAPTFRHQAFDAYKGTRKPTPEELRPQIPLLKELLGAMGIRVLEKEGFEADDILGTLSRRAEEAGMECRLVTGDRDSLQLVSDKTHVLLTIKGMSMIEEYSSAYLMEKMNLRPDQIPELKGLMGDASDNIPGIPGVGEKTALSLLERFDTVEGVLTHTEELKGKLKEKVEAGAESARFSRQLAVIDRNAPIDADPETLTLPDDERLAQGAEALRKYALLAVAHRLEEKAPSAAAAPEAPAEVHTVQTLEELAALAEAWAKEDLPAALYLGDTLSLARSSAEEWQAPLMTDLLSPGWTVEALVGAVRPLLESDTPKIVVSDDARKTGSGGRAWLSLAAGCAPRALDCDLTLAAYLLDATARKLDPASLYERYVGRLPEKITASCLVRLKEVLWPLLDKEELMSLYTSMELPLVRVLYDMEKEGFRVDRAALKALGDDFAARIAKDQEEVYTLAGERFNLNSPKQLGEVLFEKLGLPAARKTKTGYSTDAEVLEGLADRHPIIAPILRYRQLSKLNSTYVEGLTPLLDSKDKLHTRLNQTLTATGRLSSAEPNLQNIPVREAEGRQLRGVFAASGEGRVLVDADYSQIELRILAHMAQDPRMIETFTTGGDIHARTASEVFGVPPAEVTPAQRSAAKAVNFGIVYGISDFGLARQLDISRREAGDYIEKYLGTFDRIRDFMKEIIEEGRDRGYTHTLYGRRRPMPELKAKEYNVRTAAERMAMNAPIQGTAADIIKLAMVAVDRALKEKGLDARLILQVHDELIVDAREEDAETVSQLVKECMEGAAELSVPLTVEVHTGRTWMEAK